eukprot:7544078-Karenia_brevis.AAC.1
MVAEEGSVVAGPHDARTHSLRHCYSVRNEFWDREVCSGASGSKVGWRDRGEVWKITQPGYR